MVLRPGFVLFLTVAGCGGRGASPSVAADAKVPPDSTAPDWLEHRPACGGCQKPDVCVCTLAGSGALSGHEDGPLAWSRFRAPTGIAVDRLGTIYVADT
jgi:hypothetical protein